MSNLYLVSTPIGNLEDITFRAVSTLKSCDIILAEDTRVSARLCAKFDIKAPLRPYHDHNKQNVTKTYIEELKNGKNIALITDAGTPGVADPSFFLVREAIRFKITVIPIPGACAAITALVATGLPTDRFIFENFLPVKSGKRKNYLALFKNEKRTLIFYESPYRILKVLADMAEILGDVMVVIGRELTKLHEEFLRGTPQQLITHFEKRKPKGEFVICCNPSIILNTSVEGVKNHEHSIIDVL